MKRQGYEVSKGVKALTVRVTLGNDPTGKRIKVSQKFPLNTPNKNIDLWASNQRLKYRQGELILAPKLTLNEVIKQFLEAKKGSVTEKTFKDNSTILNNYISKNLGLMEIKKIKTSDIQTVISKIKRSPRRVKEVKIVLSGVFIFAKNRGYVTVNPTEQVIIPKQKGKKINIIPPSKMSLFLETIKGNKFENLFRLLALSGLRIGEALALETKHVSECAVTVEQSLDSLYNRKIGKPKTSYSYRSVTLPKELTKELLEESEKGLIFHPDSFGYNDALKALREAIKPLAINSINIHSLRHSHCVYLLSKGVPVLAVSRRLGHHSPAFTLERYGHLVPEMSEGIQGILEAL
jgi:integrase